MKRFCVLPLVAALAFCASCQKQQSEEERKAEVERQVQERLVAEHQADEKQRLAQQQADLEAREKALAEKEAATAGKGPATKSVEAPPVVRRPRDVSEPAAASYGTFYRNLEPYGAWRETSNYGYVWQPREAEESDWRPYTEGRWAYTDAGWTWISDEAFGWATYHYGRWVRLRRVGWVWVPGEEWAPAWVSWRTSKDYVGWAPLPPEARFDRRSGIRNWADNYYDIGPDQYAFVPGNEFGSRRIQRSVVPIERNSTIIIETSNVTNITYSNMSIVNHGPNYDEIRSRSRQPIERYRLERQVDAETTAPASVRGDVLVMSAPAITTVSGAQRPQTIRETLTQATVEKSWAPVTDRPAVDRALAKMKAEVTPPPDAPPRTFLKPKQPSSSGPATAASATSIDANPAATPTTAVSGVPISTSPTRPADAPSVTPAPPLSEMPTPTAPLQTRPVTASPTAAPAAKESSPAVAPQSTPESPSTSLTPRRAPQIPPRPLRSPAVTPTANPSADQPTDDAAKPLPRSNPGPGPMTSPRRVMEPGTIVTPPPAGEVEPASQPPVAESKRAVRPTPPDVTRRPPPAALPTAESGAAPSPDAKNPKRNKGVQGPGKMEDTEPRPVPADSAEPK